MKKQSNGEKQEKQLRYRFRQLKRAGKVPKDMSMKQFRGSKFNAFTTKSVKIKSKKGGHHQCTIKIYVPLSRFLEVTPLKPKVILIPVSKRQRRKDKRELRNKMLRLVQQKRIEKKQVLDCKNAAAHGRVKEGG